MGESEQRSNSDTSGSEEETKEDSINTVRRVEFIKERYTCRLFMKLQLE